MMSGPIVRKYGFPNFDQIFGKKDLEHGVDEPETPAEKTDEKPAAAEKKTEKKPKKKK